MYCHQCGQKVKEGIRFCSQCGSEIKNVTHNHANIKITEEAQPNLHSTPSNHTPKKKQKRFIRILPIMLPIISFILVGAGLIYYFLHEKEINNDVLARKESAEQAALEENYTKAKNLIEKAINNRPNYSALDEDLELIERALEYEESLEHISKNIKKMKLISAEKQLERLKEKLNKENSPIFKPFQKHIEDKEVNITVASVKQDLNDLATVEQLSQKLSILASLPKKEATAIKQEIINKIVQISSDQAENALSNHQYSEALDTINEGLQYASNNKKLLTLKDRVVKDKLAFEQAEQERMEGAMEVAGKDGSKDKSKVVDVPTFDLDFNEYGDLLISGEVKNVSETEIQSVTVYYTIYDKSEKVINKDSTTVNPYSLKPGETGTFEDTHYDVKEDVYVEVDNITWLY